MQCLEETHDEILKFFWYLLPFSCTNGEIFRCHSNKKTWKCSGRPFDATSTFCPGGHLSFSIPVPHSFAHSSVYSFTYSLMHSLIHLLIFIHSFISQVQSLVNSFILFMFYSVWLFLFSCPSETEILAKSSINPQYNFESFTDPCSKESCKNGGTCYSGSERCSCHWGSSGNDCRFEGNVELRILSTIIHYMCTGSSSHINVLPWFYVYYRVQ